MRVLVTGSSGLIGGAVVARLLAEGCGVIPFDIDGGHDILDAAGVAAAAVGCDAIVNAAGRVVTFSSVNALGVFRGEGVPDYLPIDDDHPLRPPTAYGMAKRLVEELCRCFTVSTGIATICLRPPAVLGPARHALFADARATDPAAEWTPFWEYGAYIDVRDVAYAVLAALRCADPGHVTALICADDSSSTIPARDLARRLLPDVPWRGPEPTDPARSLVRCDRARAVLAWSPRYRWTDGEGSDERPVVAGDGA